MRKVGKALGLLFALVLLFSACQNPVLISDDAQARSVSGCLYPDYEHGKVYLGGDIVHFQNADYKAKWWTQNEYPPGTSGVWEYLNPCDTLQLVTVDITAESGGSVVGELVRQVTAGDEVVIHFLPDQGYEIDTVYANWGILEVVNNSVSIVDIQADTTVRATFKMTGAHSILTNMYPLHAGTITPAGARVKTGQDQEFTIVSNPGYEIMNIVVNGKEIFPGIMITLWPAPLFIEHTFTLTNIQENQNVVVNFKERDGLRFAVKGIAGQGGAISPDGIATIEKGKSCQVSVKADPGFAIKDITVNGASVTPQTFTVLTEHAFTLSNIQEDYIVEASFAPLAPPTYTIVASAGPNGSISPAGAVIVEKGYSITFTMTPDAGYDIDTVLHNGNIVPAINGTYTIENVQEDHVLEVSFGIGMHYHVQTIAGINGSITPEGLTPVNRGASFTFTAKADSGYVIQDILINSKSILNAPYSTPEGSFSLVDEYTYTIYDINEEYVVEAVFMEKGPQPWQPGVPYEPGDLVIIGGQVYRCEYPHTSNSAWIPGTPGLWIWSLVE